MEGLPIHECVTAAIRYWEPRRLVYNAVLAVVVVICYVICLPGSQHAVTTNSILETFALAVLANVAYCAAYPVDIFAQMSNFRERWTSLRWIVFVLGTAFAAVLTRFFSLALFGVQ